MSNVMTRGKWIIPTEWVHNVRLCARQGLGYGTNVGRKRWKCRCMSSERQPCVSTPGGEGRGGVRRELGRGVKEEEHLKERKVYTECEMRTENKKREGLRVTGR